MRLFSWIKEKTVPFVQAVTYHISRVVAAIVAVGGALAGVTRTAGGSIDASRLGFAGAAFVLGMPIGLIIFGSSFNLMLWFGIVIGILFLANLHSTWEVAASLQHGGLDYIMASQAAAALSVVTPTAEDIDLLKDQVHRLNTDFQRNASRANVRPEILSSRHIKCRLVERTVEEYS